MAVSAVIADTCAVTETFTDTYINSSDNTLGFNGMNYSATLNSGTTPPATKHAAFRVTMTVGAATIDLTALAGANGATISLSGLKIQYIKFRNLAANANNIAITEGASNGYALGGTAFLWDLAPGQWISMFGNDATPDVAGGDKTIDISGTASQVLEVQVVAG